MKRAEIIKDEVVEQNLHLLTVFIETTNSCLVLLSENEDNVGTLAVAIPKPKELLGPPSSSVLLGERNSFLAQTFAEHLASKKNKLALVSVYSRTLEKEQARSIFKNLLKKILRSTQDNKGGI